ncbi:ubiquitin-associated protein 2-like isoform X14 [Pleurodeles waltl]|uniref:ubiquitin-associated protein 2-like isoform X14 n=1 Tax=Pleurodeles waltl TaxID=8319 RepID=UPI0037097A83
MMTSVGANRARGSWEQTQTQSQTQHKQRPQATAEQIRLAQMISDHNDTDFEEKVKQLIDITGKNQDECVIALHDCNGDVNRAINVLLEGNPDTHSWEMVGKKKAVSGQKDGGQTEATEEAKENRERDRDYSRRRGGPPRRGRGGSRGREFRGQENGLDYGKSSGLSGRGTERGRRGRGRGRGGSGRRGGRFSAQGMGTFNPADYAEPSNMDDHYGSSSNWNSTGSMEPDDGTSAWRTATEEWGTEDWNEDLSETKIFTASSVSSVPLPAENVTITAGQRIDLAVLLGKPPSSLENDPTNTESSQNTSISQPLVFNNSKQSTITQQTSPSSFSHHSMVSLLGKGFGDVGEAKGGSTTGSQFLEQFKTAQAFAQLAAQHSQAGGGNTGSSWDLAPAPQSSSLVQYNLKSPTESTIQGPFTKRQAFTPTSMMEVFLQDKQSVVSSASNVPAPPASPLQTKSSMVPQMSPGSSDNQSSSPQPALQKLKQQKKKASLTSKIPALAVEMPGSTDISGLNLQFGALQFGSEPVLQEYEPLPAASSPMSLSQNNLYSSTASETSSLISSGQSQETGYQSSAHQTATYTSQSSAQGPLYEQRSTQTRRFPNSISSSPQKDSVQSKNGFSSVPSSQMQSPPAMESITAPSTVISESPATLSLTPVNDTVPVSTLLTAASQHSAAHGSLGHNEELPTAPQHTSSTVTQQNSISASSSVRTSTAGLLHTAVESDVGLHSPANTFSTASSTVPVPVPPPASSVSVSLSSVSSMGLGLNSNSTVTASARSTGATTSGKAPPNLPPGVPPLLPNPYIMAPGLLHPYPPQVYGYEDLQMLQTRFPLDYYSIPFPTPNTQMSGRDGSLTNNPYSGDLSKFGRGDASSPAPATTLAQPQQSPSQAHHTTQQTFLNPALPPGYSYASMPYYTGVPGLPSTFQYGPAMFPQSFEKQGFHTGTPAASFNLPSALGSAGPINAAAGYPPAPFMHILTPHQQPHSQILHHHLQQDGQSAAGPRTQGNTIPQKTQASKSAYNSYSWGPN